MLAADGKIKSLIFPIMVLDGLTLHAGVGGFDNGSNQGIQFSTLAQAAVFNGVGRTAAIAPVKIQFALKDTEMPATITLSQTWCVPHMEIQLSF